MTSYNYVFNNPVGALDETGYVPQDCPPNCATGARGAYQSNPSKVINHFSEKAQSRSLDGPNESHKTGGEIVAGSVPGVGEAADAYELATGNTITGREGSRVLGALGLAIPFAGAAALRGVGELANFSKSSLDDVAESIGSGHAFSKHVVEKGEFPGVESQGEFVGLVKGVLKNPSETKELARGRVAAWNESSDTVVIYDLNNPDKGTAFRPDNGKEYFDNLSAE